MNDQSLPLKKQPRSDSRSVTHDDIVYDNVFDTILEQRQAHRT
ncbi:GntR family transcriptional regulator, partial [Pseudomonas syringae pv. tagetis]